MRSITIHGMDDVLAERLEREARAGGLSLNRTIKKLLQKALGIEDVATTDHRRDFEGLCGVWSRREAEAFRKATQSFERVDSEDWR